jgi:carnitine-CoA ligase
VTDVSIVEAFSRASDAYAERVLVDFEGQAFTFGDLWTRAAALARGLRAAGVRAGDTVLSLLDNNEDSLATWFASNMLGAIWVPINTTLRGDFLRHVVVDSVARVAICEADLLQRLIAIDGGIGNVELVFVRGEFAVERTASFRIEPLDAALVDDADGGWHRGGAETLSMLIYTGGTTGPSKGCANSNGFVLNVAHRYLECTGRTADEVNWSPLPVFHFNVVAQTILSSVLLGGTAAIASRFSVSRFWPEIERTGAKVVNLLGSMGLLLADMADVPEMQRCFGQIRYVHGAPFPSHIQDIWQRRYGIGGIGGYYGMTEAVPLTLLRHDSVSPQESAGPVNEQDFDLRIVDDQDRELPAGTLGEVVVRPKRPNVMFAGYWRRPEATVAATRNLWFRTGDLGTLDADGFFYFQDRKSDAIRRRGENISSVEVETVYLKHPDIEQVAVHSVASDLTEDDVKVTAVRCAGSSLTARGLFEWSTERVPYFALPRYIEFRDKLPVSGIGRVHKYELRSEGVTAGTWDREADPDATWERR